MVLKVYISGMSGNKEVKKRQQRVLMILDSKNITYEVIDITEPGREADKEFMQNKSTSNGATVSDTEPRHALPPQIFNEEEYCGDYDAFDLANEIDTLEQFLKVAPPVDEVSSTQQENGDAKPTNGEDGENKENEGDKTSEDNVVKDAEENAETKQLGKRSTLRKAAGQVVLIMKVSIQFLKNVEKPKNSGDSDIKENEISAEKADATGNGSEATKADEDDNKIKDLDNNKEVDVEVEVANKNADNEKEITKPNKKEDEDEKDDVNEAEEIEKSEKAQKHEKDDETEQSKEAENIDGRESDNEIKEKQKSDDKEKTNQNISDEKEFDQNDLKNETVKQNPEEETKDNNKEMEDERDKLSESKPNEEIETVVKEDKTENDGNDVELEKDSKTAVNDAVEVEEKTEMENKNESEETKDNDKEKMKKEVDNEDEVTESIEQENELGNPKVNTNLIKDISSEKVSVETNEANGGNAKTESENQESSEEEDKISLKTNEENSDDEQGESSDKSKE